MTTPAATPADTAARPPIWPQPIPIIGLTGEVFSGKTLFGLTIAPRRTIVWDEEKSSEPYVSLGFRRFDLFTEVTKQYPRGFTPLHVFEWWLTHMRTIKPGEYDVGMLDTIQTIEAGLVDWVEAHPEHFGHTKAQYQKGGGLFWGDVKEYWKLILSDVASRFQSFVFTSHMGTVWKGSEPTTKRKPKGKETLMELASLYLQLERKPDAKGNTPAKPAAIVLKSRLANTRFDEATGDVQILPTLPPRLPEATPFRIRKYMLEPPDYSRLSDDEKVHEEKLSDDEKLQLATARALAERDTEAFRLERESRRGGRGPATAEDGGPLLTSSRVVPAVAAATVTAPSANGTATAAAASTPAMGPSPDQLETVASLRDLMWAAKGIPADDEDARRAAWLAVLAPAGVTSIKELARDDVAELITELQRAYDPFTSGPRTQAPARPSST